MALSFAVGGLVPAWVASRFGRIIQVALPRRHQLPNGTYRMTAKLIQAFLSKPTALVTRRRSQRNQLRPMNHQRKKKRKLRRMSRRGLRTRAKRKRNQKMTRIK